jgi:hypothetical protein
MLLTAVAAVCADEPKPPEGSQPTTVLAKAMPGDKEGVMLQIRTPQMVAQMVTETVKVTVPVERIADGKRVTEYVQQERRVQVTKLRPMGWRTVRVPVDGEAVFVHDLKGKKVEPRGLAKLLDEETPVLLSTNGKVDPFYLKTTKAGTLIVVMPPGQFFQGPGLVAPRGSRPRVPQFDKEKAPPPPPPPPMLPKDKDKGPLPSAPGR